MPITTQRLILEGPWALEATLATPDHARARAVVAHPHPLYGGTMDNLVVLEAESALLAAGIEVLRFNFRGVGKSAGLHDGGRGERLDLEAAARYLSERRPELPLILAGYSFGAAMTFSHMEHGGDPRPDAVLLLAPPLTHYDFGPLKTATIPIEILWGESDGLTPAQSIGKLVDAGKSVAAQMIRGAGHDLGSSAAPAELRRTLTEAITRLAVAA